MKWFIFPRLTADLKLSYEAPTGSDPLTPEIVRTRYNETAPGKFVFWASEDGNFIGFKEGIDEVTLATSDFERVVLFRRLPAKGPGMILLEAKSKDRDILESKCYSEKSDAWISHLATAIKSILGDRFVEEPIDYDC